MRLLKPIHQRGPLLLLTFAAVVFVNVIFIYNCISVVNHHKDGISFTNQHPHVEVVHSTKLTFIWREFEEFENHIKHSVESVISGNRHVSAVVISDTLPYPPLNLPQISRLKLIYVQDRLGISSQDASLNKNLDSDIVVFIPDAVELTAKDGVEYITKMIKSLKGDTKMIAWPVDSNSSLRCLGLNVKVKQWTLQYYNLLRNCSAVEGQFVLGMKTEDLQLLTSPYERPLYQAFFIQTALLNWMIFVDNKPLFTSTKVLFTDPHNKWKHKTNEYSRIKAAYKKFGIKLVHGVHGQKQWFGCNKGTARCFGTIVDNMPQYLFEGRWTPPCCLNAIRETARHVFTLLDGAGVRYWLEGGSLLGAARNNDIIPWDYDVDIGIYKEDMVKCRALQEASSNSFVDDLGYVWQQATEGDFLRVQYSETNHVHVDIFPFYPVNGTMTKKTWFKSHRQDMEFPETFLKPLERMDFVGMKASIPNHHREFLALKFGPGVIDNPKYPDDTKVV